MLPIWTSATSTRTMRRERCSLGYKDLWRQTREQYLTYCLERAAHPLTRLGDTHAFIHQISLILQATLVPVISRQDVLALHQPEPQRKPARTRCYVHETSRFGVDFCGVIALGGAHGLPEGVRKVAVVQGYSGGEQGEDVVGTRVGDENIEVLQFKLSERGPCTYFG